MSIFQKKNIFILVKLMCFSLQHVNSNNHIILKDHLHTKHSEHPYYKTKTPTPPKARLIKSAYWNND